MQKVWRALLRGGPVRRLTTSSCRTQEQTANSLKVAARETDGRVEHGRLERECETLLAAGGTDINVYKDVLPTLATLGNWRLIQTTVRVRVQISELSMLHRLLSSYAEPKRMALSCHHQCMYEQSASF